MLIGFRRRWHFAACIVLAAAATACVALNSPQFLGSALNVVGLNGLLIAMAAVGLLTSRDLPDARRCLRKPPGTNR
jgi:hypothetical protein